MGFFAKTIWERCQRSGDYQPLYTAMNLLLFDLQHHASPARIERWYWELLEFYDNEPTMRDEVWPAILSCRARLQIKGLR